MEVDLGALGIPMSEPVLDRGRRLAALREMSPAGMLQSVHVGFIARNAGEPAIHLHQLIEPYPGDPFSTLPRRKERTWLSASRFDPSAQTPELLITERMLPGNRTFSAPNEQNTVSIVKIRHLEEPDLMSPESAMVRNPENRAIALVFDDCEEALYLLHFQVLKLLFSLRTSPAIQFYSLGRLFNSSQNRPFFAHVFVPL